MSDAERELITTPLLCQSEVRNRETRPNRDEKEQQEIHKQDSENNKQYLRNPASAILLESTSFLQYLHALLVHTDDEQDGESIQYGLNSERTKRGIGAK